MSTLDWNQSQLAKLNSTWQSGRLCHYRDITKKLGKNTNYVTIHYNPHIFLEFSINRILFLSDFKLRTRFSRFTVVFFSRVILLSDLKTRPFHHWTFRHAHEAAYYNSEESSKVRCKSDVKIEETFKTFQHKLPVKLQPHYQLYTIHKMRNPPDRYCLHKSNSLAVRNVKNSRSTRDLHPL